MIKRQKSDSQLLDDDNEDKSYDYDKADSDNVEEEYSQGSDYGDEEELDDDKND